MWDPGPDSACKRVWQTSLTAWVLLSTLIWYLFVVHKLSSIFLVSERLTEKLRFHGFNTPLEIFGRLTRDRILWMSSTHVTASIIGPLGDDTLYPAESLFYIQFMIAVHGEQSSHPFCCSWSKYRWIPASCTLIFQRQRRQVAGSTVTLRDVKTANPVGCCTQRSWQRCSWRLGARRRSGAAQSRATYIQSRFTTRARWVL